ncbi:MAG: hypothetical protein JO190_07535 [Candidatus Eremiobacteraeota bacterium]|nr:hypothetical protein [Candidatus Eremiobacteraeota bacterium]MBV8498053.1 hypothetical protein [Candidatus Eremiobacteraeota bacterium]
MLSSLLMRRVGLGATLIFAFTLAGIPGQAQQMRQQMADKVAENAGNTLVQKINGESCSDFANMMAQMKHQSSGGSSSSSMSQKLKANTEARTQFVNIVAAPLLNKMISCNMLPGGM